MKGNLFIDDTIQYVLFLNDIPDIVLTLEALKLQQFDPNAKFIIICFNENECDENETIPMLWSYKILNVIFIKYENNAVSGYVYFPNEDCDHPTPERVQNWEDCIHSYKDSKQVCTTRSIFPLKLMNFHRCPLIVSTFELNPFMLIKDGIPSGTDGDVMRITGDAVNASLVVISPSDGKGWGYLVNNTWIGSLGDLDKKLANISFTGSATMNLERYHDFDISTIFNTITMVWLIHPLRLESSSVKLLKPFTAGAWFFISITFGIFVLSHYFIDHSVWRIFSKVKRIDTFSHYFIAYTVQITLGVSVTKYPVNLCKHLILYWIWYWFLVRTLYQVNLIYFLQTDVKVDTIHNIQDAIAEGYTFGGGKPLKEFYSNDPFIYNNWKSDNSTDLYANLGRIMTGGKFTYGANTVFAKVFQRNTHLEIHALPKKIVESYSVVYFARKSAVTRPVNLVFARLFEAGIVKKIFEDYTSTLPEPQENANIPLTLNHFTGCFGILILGWVLSCIAFIFEILNSIRLRKKLLNVYVQ
ncbi:uncharacterized protein LOC125063426 [Pieris napi]|uniref:uncharacterized protein LOC125063426 n=1 Tax=Pieris napi TaxID=78633 RepID=UPI001FB8E7C4|nr:uncharacterized protein LOC125063426 [Pieris napi]